MSQPWFSATGQKSAGSPFLGERRGFASASSSSWLYGQATTQEAHSMHRPASTTSFISSRKPGRAKGVTEREASAPTLRCAGQGRMGGDVGGRLVHPRGGVGAKVPVGGRALDRHAPDLPDQLADAVGGQVLAGGGAGHARDRLLHQ